MGYSLSAADMDRLIGQWSEEAVVFAPVRKAGHGMYSDTDSIQYGQITSAEEIVFDEKSNFSFKEVFLPLSETLFFFTEENIKEANPLRKKGAVIFLRSCDLHAVKRLDEIYLRNGFEDHYYKRLRENTVFVLMGCHSAFENCFCVDMETNRTEDYDCYIEKTTGGYLVENRRPEWEEALNALEATSVPVEVAFVTETSIHVSIPENLGADVAKSKMWDEYDGRCINCGRCNFVCPTCTCFTMQDIFYQDNGKAGERRRVMASCMVDGFTDVAGGGAYRKKNGERMRFRVLHKVYDYKKRFGYHMCVGCGRCDDVCPEYIMITTCINNLEEGMREVSEHDAK